MTLEQRFTSACVYVKQLSAIITARSSSQPETCPWDPAEIRVCDMKMEWVNLYAGTRGFSRVLPNQARMRRMRSFYHGTTHCYGFPSPPGTFLAPGRGVFRDLAATWVSAGRQGDRLLDGSPVGKRLNLGTPEKPEWWDVVGEARNVKAFGLERPDLPTLYRPYEQHPWGLLAFTIRTAGDPAALIHSAQEAVWDVDKDQPVFRALPMTTLAVQSVALRRVSTLLLAGFAALALVLAAVGIYGVMAYSVARRTYEIGTRMALGAQPNDVLRLVLGEGARLTICGVVFGALAALVLTRFMASFLFEISASDPLTFAGVAILLAFIALLACYVPARRATHIDPIAALKYE